MMPDQDDQAFVSAAKSVLDRSAQELDGETIARLHRTRRHALEARPQRAPWVVWAGGLAAACVALVVGALWWAEPSQTVPVAGLEDIELITSADNLELYEDLDFYRWLADAGSAG